MLFRSVRDLLHHLGTPEKKIIDLIRPVLFLPGTKGVLPALEEMRTKRHHLAIVLDEYGGTDGIITLENLLESFVGEIGDEYDEDQEQFEWLSENKVRVQATIHLEDLVKELDTEIDLTIYQGVDTIGGAMAKVLGRVPIPGSHFMFGVWKVTAERPIGRRRRISSMIIERTEDQSEDEL